MTRQFSAPKKPGKCPRDPRPEQFVECWKGRSHIDMSHLKGIRPFGKPCFLPFLAFFRSSRVCPKFGPSVPTLFTLSPPLFIPSAQNNETIAEARMGAGLSYAPLPRQWQARVAPMNWDKRGLGKPRSDLSRLSRLHGIRPAARRPPWERLFISERWYESEHAGSTSIGLRPTRGCLLRHARGRP